MSRKSEIIENHVIKLNETLEDIKKYLEHRITSMEEKLELIMKRQSDIEEKILFRIEKNNPINSSSSSTSSTSLSSIDNIDTRTILLKNKDEVVKKTRKKTTTSYNNEQINRRGEIDMKVYNDIILLTGQTYDRKELIKQYKGRWDNKNGGWTVPLENKDKLKADLEKYSENLEYEELDDILNKDEIKRCENFQKLTHKTIRKTLYNEGKKIKKNIKNN
jgi:hypothetical protein